MATFTTLTARAVVLPVNDIDTDQIIPARFLKTTDKLGLGKSLFADWRYLADGSPKPDFVLNQPGAAGAQVLVAGDNFGCGSSREHAPWALTGFGFRVVVSTSFADIFKNNALKNGLIPVTVDAATHAELLAALAKDPAATVAIDLAAQTVTLPGGRAVRFPIDAFSRTCLLEGVDELGYILKHEARIAAHERGVPGGAA
ncbi:MAG: 3-isopropylmalate dehydratase small subunit [Anaeromyxobacter sp.]|nr:3-isopropylmalate dehydratase small subunit [Anaeromyxobacter sp.]MBL0277506.1 3-isopropylmalate dehydratase small subunit [Anaeromyxobacter sp.]